MNTIIFLPNNERLIFIPPQESGDDMIEHHFPESIDKEKDFVQLRAYSDDIFSDALLIEAAGGIVSNSKNELCFIFRHNKWDLPKGKIEHSESHESAAVREVQEETGLQNVLIQKFIDTTRYLYFENDSPVLKKTYWYAMQSLQNNMLQPQIEEGITHVEWIHYNNIQKVFDNTYPSIRHLLELYFQHSQ